jgi:hypothetical protein
MRWFLTLAVATVAIALVDSTPAKAQIVIGGYQIGGYPAYTPRYYAPYTPYSPYTRVVTPANSTALTNYNGGMVDVGADWALKSAGLVGYGPYAGTYFGYPANLGQWNGYRVFNNPTNWNWAQPNWKMIEPRNLNPVPRGFFKGKGR